jgi:uncharacterized protein
LKIAFDWDSAKAHSNLRKHGASSESAMAVFADPLALSVPDDVNAAAELRWVTIGAGKTGPLVVIHTFSESVGDFTLVRIISCRRTTRRELRDYREGTL